jgi:hypothetical protein
VRNEIDSTINNKKFYNDDYRAVALSLMLGKPLIGQQMIDECSARDFVCERLNIKSEAIMNNRWHWALSLYSHFPNDWYDIVAYPAEQKNKLRFVVPDVLW